MVLPTFFIIVWIIYLSLIRQQKRKEQERLQEAIERGEIIAFERSINHFQEQLKISGKNKAIKDIMREIQIVKYEGKDPEQKCCISKSKFTIGEEISRCPFCKSLFKKEYLTVWLMKNEICPVCRVKIIVRSF